MTSSRSTTQLQVELGNRSVNEVRRPKLISDTAERYSIETATCVTSAAAVRNEIDHAGSS
jgi:hypothetical protein